MSQTTLQRLDTDRSRVTVSPMEGNGFDEAVAGDGTGAAVPDPAESLPPSLSLDVVFGLLSVERRRRTLADLRRTGGETTLSDLATRLAAEENDIPVERVTSDQRKRVYIALYQSHLPKLDDADVVEFEAARGTIELDSNAPLLYPYLDLGDGMAPERPTRSSPVRRRLSRWLSRLGLG